MFLPSTATFLATAFGFGSRSAHVRVEQFMREVYTHMRNIYLITRTVEDRLALLPQSRKGLPGLPGLRRWIRGKDSDNDAQLMDGFKIANGQIHAASNRIFRDQPRRLMRVFLHAQQRGLRIHPDLAQRIRQELALVDRDFRHDEHVRETFLEILNQRGNVAPVLRAMHEVGLLGKYLPEFGRLTCLVQHEFYHRYTADEHTLLCLEKLDQLWESGPPPGHATAPCSKRSSGPSSCIWPCSCMMPAKQL
jgi:[protein-PII] uridylyltransferase